jgi:GMP synthase-like glutamine amidotransferase
MRNLKLFKEFNTYKKEDYFLVIDNSKPPKNKYLNNVLKYLDTTDVSYKIVETIDELLETINNYNIIGAISTGSDFRVNDIETNELNFKSLELLECPVYGICYGFQSMAKYYGSEIGSVNEVCENLILDSYDKNELIFNGIDLDNTKLSFCFHDFPLEVPNGFKIISEINNKISGISNGKNRFGTLFHPENINETFPILDNFINLCKVKI